MPTIMKSKLRRSPSSIDVVQRIPFGQDGILPNYSSSSSSSSSIDPTSTVTAAASTNTNMNMGPIVGIIVPVVTALAGLTIIAILLLCRNRIRSFFRRRRNPPTTATSSGDLSRTVTANELSGEPTPPSTIVTTDRSNEDRRVRGPRGRALRRTESGRSIRTLPKYSKEAGDEELVLVRQRSQSMFSEESVDDIDPNAHLDGADGDERTHVDERLLTSNTPLPADDDTASVRNDGEENELTVRRSPFNANEEHPIVPQSAPLLGAVPLPRAGGTASRTWGEAPTYLEAMSSPPIVRTDPEMGLPPGQSMRTRTSSTFRDFLHRTGFVQLALSTRVGGGGAPSFTRQTGEHRRAASSTSLLLQPQTSRLSSSTTRSPYGYASPAQSTQSLMISSPIPHTAVRASFDSTVFPKAGLSDDQMRFLSSSDAVNLAGIRLEDVPLAKKRRRSSVSPLVGAEGDGEELVMAVGEGAEPPSWDQSQEERRRNDARERRNLARPAGSDSDELDMGRPEAEDVQLPSGYDEEGQSAGADGASPNKNGDLHTSDSLPPRGPVFEVEPPTPITSGPRFRIPSMTNTTETITR